jgi:hypothetical protein
MKLQSMSDKNIGKYTYSTKLMYPEYTNYWQLSKNNKNKQNTSIDITKQD